MSSVSAADHCRIKPTEPNMRRFAIFVSLSMACFAAGYILLKAQTAPKVDADIKDEAFRMYTQHSRELDAIGEKYSNEMNAAKVEFQSGSAPLE